MKDKINNILIVVLCVLLAKNVNSQGEVLSLRSQLAYFQDKGNSLELELEGGAVFFKHQGEQIREKEGVKTQLNFKIIEKKHVFQIAIGEQLSLDICNALEGKKDFLVSKELNITFRKGKCTFVYTNEEKHFTCEVDNIDRMIKALKEGRIMTKKLSKQWGELADNWLKIKVDERDNP